MITNIKSKRVLITGNTGFKGSWLHKILLNLGADVYGFSIDKQHNLLEKIGSNYNQTTFGSVTNYEFLEETIQRIKPEIIFHLAAQPLVRLSYDNPRNTYETNVMGTVNILESIRGKNFVKSFVNITTDKVYKNNEWIYAYKEIDSLDGFDPYSNSKSCSELITSSYKRSFKFNMPAISTARSGNVIGGGDYSIDRIVPDFVKAAQTGNTLTIRNPNSIRPYLHVLESLFAYILIAIKQMENDSFSGNFNIGPIMNETVTTERLVNSLAQKWPTKVDYKIFQSINNSKHEAGLLKLDTSLIHSVFGWKPLLTFDEAIDLSVDWYLKSINDVNQLSKLSDKQILDYYEKCKHLFK